MARLKGNIAMKGVSGMLGANIVFRQVGEKTVLSNRPTKRKRLSPGQKTTVKRFTRAQRYAKERMTDPAMKALYKKGITAKKTSAYAVAASDFLNPPKLHYIKVPDYNGAVDTVITIKATDDFRVASVDVSITNGHGVLLETGPATAYRLKPFIWKYKTTVMNTAVSGTIVKVTAKDYANNEVSAVLICYS
jgi:hypothetical protein